MRKTDIKAVVSNLSFLKRFMFRKLLWHELGHAFKLASFQNKQKPYIVFGIKIVDIKRGRGEKQYMNKKYITFIHRGFNVYLPASKDWRMCAVTEIDDRRVLSKEQIKKALIAPVKKEYTGFIAVALFIAASVFKVLNISGIGINSLLSIWGILAVGFFPLYWFSPQGLPWKERKILNSDCYLYHNPEKYYSYGE